jgi:hypothetical protein
MIPSLPTAKSSEEVQGAVSELIKDRILIGHAIQNDLKVSLSLLCAVYNFPPLLRPSCYHIRGRKFVTRKFWLTGMVKAARRDLL